MTPTDTSRCEQENEDWLQTPERSETFQRWMESLEDKRVRRVRSRKETYDYFNYATPRIDR
jgi:hypothetical protein